MKPTFISLRIKMLVVIVLRITIVYLVMYLWIYNFFTDSSTRALRADVETLLDAGSASISGDVVAGLTAAPRLDTTDSRYRAITDWFTQLRNYNPHAAAYLYYQPSPGKFVVLADSVVAQGSNTLIAYHVGQQLDAGDGRLINGLTTQTTNLDIHSGRQGSAVSGITPIRDSSGEVVAALVVETAPDTAAADQLRARSNLLPLLGIVYFLLSFSVWFISSNLTRSVRALDHVTRRIGEGDYTAIQSKSGLFPDEITHLEQTINQMAEKVRGREETLRRQVEKLTIQVDQSKREKAVKEVVDSDFFMDLQSKARSLRENHHDD